MTLDVRTMYIAMAATCFIVAAALLTLQTQRFRRNGALQWALGWAFQGTFWMLVGLRGIIGDFLSIVIAHTFLTASYSLFYAAIRRFQGRSYNTGMLLSPVAATFIFFWYFSAYVDNLLYRILFISLLAILQISGIVRALLRNAPVKERLSYWLTGFAFLLMALVWFNRMLEGLTLPYGQLSILQITTFRNTGLIVSLGVVVLSSIGFVLMIRERAQEALRQSEGRYRSIFNGMTEGFALHEIICDEKDEPLDYRFLEVNPAFERLTGLKQEKVMGRRVSEVLPDIEPHWVKTYGAVALTGQSVQFENYSSALNKHYEVFAYCPAPRQFAVLFMDITERKRAEEESRRLLNAVQEEKDRLSALINSIQDEVWFADTSKRFILANPSALREFGLDTDSGMDVQKFAESLEVYRPDGSPRPVDEAPSLRALRGEAVRNQEEIIRTPASGELRYRQCSFAPVRDLGGTIIGSVSVVRDITERKRMEEELRQVAETFEKTFQGNAAAMALSRIEDGRVLDLNDRWLELTGFRREEIIGKTSAELGLWKNPEDRNAMARDVQQQGAVRERECACFRKNGQEWTALFSAQIITVRGERALISSAIDVTARKLAEEALRKAHDELERRVQERTGELRQAYESLKAETAQREHVEQQLLQAQKMEAVGTLSGGIAHDFNNILAAIIGFTEMVIDDVSDNADVRHKMEQVLKAGLRGRDLVKQILTFSRRSDREKKALHLSPLVRETFKMLRASIPTTIDMKLDLDVSRDSVQGDPSQVQQIVMNLCANASHAMREKGGTLEVSLRAITLDSRELLPEPDMSPGDYLILSVSDTGHGMDDAVLKRIFEPFFTTKERGQGTGLGLSVVYGIVKSHQGGVTVSSRAGQGSVFRVYLPAASPASGSEGETASWETLPTGTERICFVDDEEAIIELSQGVLTRLGYTVVTARSGREALEAFKEDGTFDLVITDQTMPGMTGVMLAAELLKLRPDLPVILCTGYSETVSRETAQEVGIREFLMKPLSKGEMAKAIRRALVSAPKSDGEVHPGGCSH